MTGPEHYREAERLLNELILVDPENLAITGVNLQLAQVHATLALAAAEALATTATRPPHTTDAGKDWREVLQPVEVSS